MSIESCQQQQQQKNPSPFSSSWFFSRDEGGGGEKRKEEEEAVVSKNVRSARKEQNKTKKNFQNSVCENFLEAGINLIQWRLTSLRGRWSVSMRAFAQRIRTCLTFPLGSGGCVCCASSACLCVHSGSSSVEATLSAASVSLKITMMSWRGSPIGWRACRAARLRPQITRVA